MTTLPNPGSDMPLRPFHSLRDFGAFQHVPQTTPQVTVPGAPEPRQPMAYATHRPQIRQSQVASTQTDTSKVATDTEQLQHEQRKRRLIISLRGSVSLVLLGYLLITAPWTSLFTTLHALNLGLVGIAFLLGGMSSVAYAFQWHRLLRAEHIRFDLADLIKLHLVSLTFYHFLPTSIDGDTLKATYVGKCADNPTGAASAMMLCHVTSFLGMLVIAVPMLVLRPERFPFAISMWFVLLALGISALFSGALLVSLMLPEIIFGKWLEYRPVRALLLLGNTLSISLNRPRALLFAISYGLLSWLCAIFSCQTCALALDMHIPLAFYCVAVPLVTLVSILPISLCGFGLREVILIAVFSAAPIPAGSALALALLLDAQLLFFSALGGYHYFTLGRHSV
ncbi:hypothetical protein KSD_29000 [Ktedonobacter sp. SOSP1-85]|uniref:lysylphosphatidylglycerol synthase transmembrane domain-containing protein n=1 Tax=Ktedonobacter sp. SOSP1-85 TaxID=2778367 RepID=UPI0019167F87|nr:lysylphosphatidylglycerol synthase transmembrane domain-containing protein [Ktedonobacter sp. SOSP1-85]GHO75129.1 hypothetical protein KSD_29000 [Ktedonobacter sp. SOSP1-85]